MKEKGPLGVLHGNKDGRSSHAFPPELRERVIELVKAKYFHFNFCNLSEILAAEEELCINRETLRRWLGPLGFGRKLRKRRTHPRKRKRSPQG